MRRIPYFVLPLVLVAGCASKATDRTAFDDVQRLVGERTGRHVQWNTDSDADRSVDDVVERMLDRELTVDNAIQIALINNRNLQATYEDLGIAQADLVSAGLLKNPILEGDLLFSTAGGGTGVELTVLADFLEILWIPMRTRVAASAMQETKARVAGKVIDLAFDVRRSYVDLQAAQQMLEMRQTVAGAMDAGFDLATRLHEAGTITDLDLANEQAAREQARLEVTASEFEVSQLRQRLGVLMGVGEGARAWTITPRLAALPDNEMPEPELEAIAIDRSLELTESKERIVQLAERLGLSRSTALWDGTQLGAKGERDISGGWGVGPAFSIPIPLFDQGKTKIAVAQAQLRREQQRRAAMLVEIRSELRVALSRLQLSRARAVAFERTVLPLRERIVQETQLQFNAMSVSVFELLVARQQQIEAGAQYIESLRDYWRAHAALDQIMAGRQAPNDGGI